MTEDIGEYGILPAVERRSPGEYSGGQRQQWRLAFEKAYVEAGRKNAEANAKTQAAEAVAAEPREMAVDAKPVSPEPARYSVSDVGGAVVATPGVYVFSADSSEFLQVLNRVESGRIAQQLFFGGRNTTIEQNPNALRAEFVSGGRDVNRVQTGGNTVFGDKAVSLLLSEKGLQLVIRDAGVSAGVIEKIVSRVHSLLSDSGLRLTRVVVNGEEFWNESGDIERVSRGSGDDLSGLVNRVY